MHRRVLGSYVHATTSFVSYVGNRRLVFSWAWWYLLRPFIGMVLALIFYFVLRGGLLASMHSPIKSVPSASQRWRDLSGCSASRRQTSFRELFDNIFKTERGKGE